MTDPKGDRGKAPADQSDPDLFVRVVERRPGGVVLGVRETIRRVAEFALDRRDAHDASAPRG